MDTQEELSRRLIQTNRMLKLGYLVIGVLAMAGYTLAQAGPLPPGASDPDGNQVIVDINKVGDAQSMVAVDDERGFAVLIDEEGKINVVHRDGTVLVPNRKTYSHVYQEHQLNKDFVIDRPVDR